MNRPLLVLGLLVLLGANLFYTKTRLPESIVVRVDPPVARLDSGMQAVSVAIVVGNRGLPRLRLLECEGRPDIVMQRQVNGLWFTHSPVSARCRGAAKRVRRTLQPGESLITELVLRQPGRYRAKVAFAAGVQDTIGFVLSPEFLVRPAGPPNLGLKLPGRLAAPARVQLGPQIAMNTASAANAPARSLNPSR